MTALLFSGKLLHLTYNLSIMSAEYFQGKVIVVTGAASGIGLETAKLLASKGAKVSLADVQGKELREAATDIESSGGTVMTTVVDISKRAQVEEWIAQTVQKFGRINGAANLAGVIGKFNNISSVEEIDDDDFDFIMKVNVYGLLNCMRAQIPHMEEPSSSM